MSQIIFVKMKAVFYRSFWKSLNLSSFLIQKGLYLMIEAVRNYL